MVESKSVPETSSKLSATDRLTLIQTLNALPPAQFEELLMALNPPNGNIPSNTAPQANRSKALFEWLESPIGAGLEILDQLLNRIIAKTTQRSKTFVAFSISGKISNATMSEVKAFVELLRKKTGDDSIDVAFFEEGSIRMILSSSSEGLQKLKELVETGELEGSETPRIETVYDVAASSTSARKARLIEILRHTRKTSIALDFAHTIFSARKHARGFAGSLGFGLPRAIADGHNLARNLARASTLANDLNLDPNLVSDLDLLSNRAFALSNDLNHTPFNDFKLLSAHAFDLNNDLFRALVNAHKRVPTFLRVLDLPSVLDLRGADLKEANLRNINLRQADLTGVDFTRADLTGANFTDANLTDANLTDANVARAIFGNNPGITEDYKRDLQRRGASLLDPPSSDAFSPALH